MSDADNYRAESTIPCGECRLCCTGGEAVTLHPEMGDDPSLYVKKKIHLVITEDHETLLLPPTMKNIKGKSREYEILLQKPNGDCFYLGEKGCTIYDKRPHVCRTFTCVKLFDSLGRMPAMERRKAVAFGGDGKRGVIEKGRQMKRLIGG